MIGEERGIKWEVTDYISPANIIIYDSDNTILHKEEYNWMHEPIFGPDIDDVVAINERLDELIKKFGH